jgi:hypothetical protein
MPLAYLVEWNGVDCFGGIVAHRASMRSAMQAFCLRADAPLAHWIGTQVKQDWEIWETRLASPPILHLATFAAASPLATGKWK